MEHGARCSSRTDYRLGLSDWARLPTTLLNGTHSSVEANRDNLHNASAFKRYALGTSRAVRADIEFFNMKSVSDIRY